MQKTLRIVALVAVFGLIFFALIKSSVTPAGLGEKVWNENMAFGDVDHATRHYIVYTDLMCPYCNYYARISLSNLDELNEFIADHKIAYEIRVTDTLYEGNGVENSLPAAEGAYCAAREGRFLDYYSLAVTSLFEDYYSKGVGNSKTAEPISDMARDYWLNPGKELELGENFERCFEKREAVEEVHLATLKSSSVVGGLPFFVFGRYTNGGFDPNWNWSQVETMLNAGLK